MPVHDSDSRPREPWLTKHQLADLLAVSDRWIELQQHIGLPYLRMGGLNRYRISEVEAWLREHYDSPDKSN
jgi:phage terminase Nu1 subunit (DNA packaging protein)